MGGKTSKPQETPQEVVTVEENEEVVIELPDVEEQWSPDEKPDQLDDEPQAKKQLVVKTNDDMLKVEHNATIAPKMADVDEQLQTAKLNRGSSMKRKNSFTSGEANNAEVRAATKDIEAENLDMAKKVESRRLSSEFDKKAANPHSKEPEVANTIIQPKLVVTDRDNIEASKNVNQSEVKGMSDSKTSAVLKAETDRTAALSKSVPTEVTREALEKAKQIALAKNKELPEDARNAIPLEKTVVVEPPKGISREQKTSIKQTLEKVATNQVEEKNKMAEKIGAAAKDQKYSRQYSKSQFSMTEEELAEAELRRQQEQEFEAEQAIRLAMQKKAREEEAEAEALAKAEKEKAEKEEARALAQQEKLEEERKAIAARLAKEEEAVKAAAEKQARLDAARKYQEQQAKNHPLANLRGAKQGAEVK